jgi:CRP-like cAMP-binding protein
MLRTNPAFLQFIQKLFASNQEHEAFAIRTYPKGSLLLKQGAAAVRVSVIKEGITKCYFSEENGKDFIIEFLSEGEILGDLEALRNNVCLCNVEALTNVKVYSINMDYFRTERPYVEPAIAARIGRKSDQYQPAIFHATIVYS